MSFLGIRAPYEVARLIHEIDIPGIKQDTNHLHITLLYLGQETPIEELAKAMIATYAVSQNTSPFQVKLNSVDYFDVDDGNKYPIIAPITSNALSELNTNLKKSFDKMKVGYNKKFKTYKPHITLSFNDEPIKKTKIEPIVLSISELVLWCGSDGDNRMTITFPLEIKENENISEKCCIE